MLDEQYFGAASFTIEGLSLEEKFVCGKQLGFCRVGKGHPEVITASILVENVPKKYHDEDLDFKEEKLIRERIIGIGLEKLRVFLSCYYLIHDEVPVLLSKQWGISGPSKMSDISSYLGGGMVIEKKN